MSQRHILRMKPLTAAERKSLKRIALRFAIAFGIMEFVFSCFHASDTPAGAVPMIAQCEAAGYTEGVCITVNRAVLGDFRY